MNEVESLACVVGAVLLLVLVLIWRPRRERDKLADRYSYASPPAAGFSGLGRVIGEATAKMAWGSPSVTTWRRACAASLHASRRRRGLEGGNK